MALWEARDLCRESMIVPFSVTNVVVIFSWRQKPEHKSVFGCVSVAMFTWSEQSDKWSNLLIL